MICKIVWGFRLGLAGISRVCVQRYLSKNFGFKGYAKCLYYCVTARGLKDPRYLDPKARYRSVQPWMLTALPAVFAFEVYNAISGRV